MDQGYAVTAALFRTLSPTDREVRLDVARDLAELIRFWRGDPLLNSWQEGFLANVAHWLWITDGRCRISEKQWVKIREIQDLIEGADQRADAEADAEEVD